MNSSSSSTFVSSSIESDLIKVLVFSNVPSLTLKVLPNGPVKSDSWPKVIKFSVIVIVFVMIGIVIIIIVIYIQRFWRDFCAGFGGDILWRGAGKSLADSPPKMVCSLSSTSHMSKAD